MTPYAQRQAGMIWAHEFRELSALADALERDAEQIGPGFVAQARAWLARRDARLIREALEPKPRPQTVIAEAPTLNPDGTGRDGRIVDYCRFMAFYARKARREAEKANARILAERKSA